MPNTIFYSNAIKDEYIRWHETLKNEDKWCDDKFIINVTDVLRAHFTIVDYFSEFSSDACLFFNIGPKDPSLLCSAVARQASGFDGILKWTDNFTKIATLVYGINKNHAFHDGNKRTSLLIALYSLHIVGRTPVVDQKIYEKLMLQIANDTLSVLKDKYKIKEKDDWQIYTIAEFLRKTSRPNDKSFYEVTYNELNNILHKFGFGLESPMKNFIDVVRYEEKSFWFKKKTISTKVCHIGFPGWTRKVGRQCIKIVRSSTGLTPERGYDSKVFFQGVDPLKSLVHDYSAPLRRLAHK